MSWIHNYIGTTVQLVYALSKQRTKSYRIGYIPIPKKFQSEITHVQCVQQCARYC